MLETSQQTKYIFSPYSVVRLTPVSGGHEAQVRILLRRPIFYASGGTGIHDSPRSCFFEGSNPSWRTILKTSPDGAIGRRASLRNWLLRVRVPLWAPCLGQRCVSIFGHSPSLDMALALGARKRWFKSNMTDQLFGRCIGMVHAQ